MAFLATIDASPRPESMKFPVFSQLAGNLGSETGSLETPSSSGESVANFRRVPSRFVLECGTGLYGYSPAVHVDFRPYYLGRLIGSQEQ